MLGHIKNLGSLDPTKVKPDVLQRLAMLAPDFGHESVLATADASLNISLLYGGYFPLATFNLRDQILPVGTFANNLLVKIVRLVSSEDCKCLLALG